MATRMRSWKERVASSRDDCGYRAHADRIADYQIVRTPESVLPFVSDRDRMGGHPDGCSQCGKATWWASRTLADGRLQTRCTECGGTLTWD